MLINTNTNKISIEELQSNFNKIKSEKSNLIVCKITEEIFLGLIEGKFTIIFSQQNSNKEQIIITKHLKVFTNQEVELNFSDEHFKLKVLMVQLLSENEFLRTFQIFILNIINFYDELKEKLVGEIYKIIELFEHEKNNKKSYIGLFGELLFIDFLLKNNYVINEYWHRNMFNKYDFEFNNEFFIEIKTTISNIRNHKFSQTQIFSEEKDKKIIASILLHEIDSGINLYTFSQILKNDANDYYLIKKIDEFVYKNKINESSDNISIDIEKSLNSLRFFDAYFLPKILDSEIPNEVHNLKYDVCLENIVPLQNEYFFLLINKYL